MDKLVDINGLQQYHNTIKNKLVPTSTTKGQVLTTDENGVKWKDVTDILPNPEYLLAYGVEWDINVADPHLTRIGNMSMHKTLPIQSKLKGCIAQGNKIMYWLDEKNWFFKEGAQICDVTLVHTWLGTDKGENSDEIWLPLSSLELDAVLEYVGKRWQLFVNGAPIIVDTRLGGTPDFFAVVLTPVYGDVMLIDGAEETRLYMCGEGSRLDGYDGTVRVYCPDFYIKSESNGDKRRVWLSTVKIDNTWVYQHEILIDAYRSTILNTVPADMGYLTTLPQYSAISVVNTADYCRGGGNRPANDIYLTGSEDVQKDICKTDLGKPRTNIPRSTMRTYARKAGSELLSYEQYKNIFYWLWVVEYANFNSQEEFNPTLTQEGYHQGGMGTGVTTWDRVSQSNYNGNYPLTPCGYLNDLGNRTGIKKMTAGTKTFPVPRWRGFDNPFGDIWTNLDGCIHNDHIFYVINDPQNYTDSMTDEVTKADRAVEECHSNAHYYKEFNIGDSADIVPLEGGGSGGATTYKCDYHWTSSGGPHTLLVGGHAIDSSTQGLGVFDSSGDVSRAYSSFGFRSVSSFVSFQDNQ